MIHVGLRPPPGHHLAMALESYITRHFTSTPRALTDLIPTSHPATTRVGWYASHLHSCLIMKGIIKEPKFATRLQQVAQAALDENTDRLVTPKYVPVEKLLLKEDGTEEEVEVSQAPSTDVRGKSGVIAYYQRAIAPICAPIASTLGLHPTFWGCILELTNTASTIHGAANTDAALEFKSTVMKAFAEPVPKTRVFKAMAQGIPGLCTKMAEWLKVIMIWEFKSLSVMEKVVNCMNAMTGEWAWKLCPDLNCDCDKPTSEGKEMAQKMQYQSAQELGIRMVDGGKDVWLGEVNADEDPLGVTVAQQPLIPPRNPNIGASARLAPSSSSRSQPAPEPSILGSKRQRSGHPVKIPDGFSKEEELMTQGIIEQV